MKNSILRSRWVFIAVQVALLAGCALAGKPPTIEYDLGQLSAPVAQTLSAPISVSVAEIQAPVWLDTPMMFFRLAYVNDLQPRHFANSRWTMPPAQLFSQRLKSRFAQTGITVLSASDGALNVPLLRLEADDFTQLFSSATQSTSRVAIRASLFNVRTLIANKTFIAELPAPTADANGGALALAAASDKIIADMISWLAQMPSPAK